MAARRAKFKGRILLVRFLDHVEGDQGPMQIELVGRCVKANPREFVITTWRCLNGNAATKAHNTIIYTILRSTVLEYRILDD